MPRAVCVLICIEGAVRARVNKLYKILERRYQGDATVWLSHISWCRDQGWEAADCSEYRGPRGRAWTDMPEQTRDADLERALASIHKDCGHAVEHEVYVPQWDRWRRRCSC